MTALKTTGCVTIDEASLPGAWLDAIRWAELFNPAARAGRQSGEGASPAVASPGKPVHDARRRLANRDGAATPDVQSFHNDSTNTGEQQRVG